MEKVKLVGITNPIGIGDGTPEGAIAYMARVSNPSNQNNMETAPKLLKYCIKKGHWSIFEMVSMVVEIQTTRDISRQILRHRSFSFQEFSQRYAKVQQFVTREARLQDEKNRQNSIEMDMDNTANLIIAQTWESTQQQILNDCRLAYEWALGMGIAKEQARAVLPEGMAMSTLYMAGTLRSFWHFVQVRHHPAAQKEVREIAVQISEIIKQNFPSMAEFMDEMIANNYNNN